MSYVWSNINISQYSLYILAHWSIKAVAIVEISSFAYFISVSMYSHIQIVHMVWPSGIKTNGNYRNFIIFTCFIRSIMCYVYSNTKIYVISPLVWLVGYKSWGNYQNFDNFPSISCRLVKIVKPSV